MFSTCFHSYGRRVLHQAFTGFQVKITKVGLPVSTVYNIILLILFYTISKCEDKEAVVVVEDNDNVRSGKGIIGVGSKMEKASGGPERAYLSRATLGCGEPWARQWREQMGHFGMWRAVGQEVA